MRVTEAEMRQGITSLRIVSKVSGKAWVMTLIKFCSIKQPLEATSNDCINLIVGSIRIPR